MSPAQKQYGNNKVAYGKTSITFTGTFDPVPRLKNLVVWTAGRDTAGNQQNSHEKPLYKYIPLLARLPDKPLSLLQDGIQSDRKRAR